MQVFCKLFFGYVPGPGTPDTIIPQWLCSGIKTISLDLNSRVLFTSLKLTPLTDPVPQGQVLPCSQRISQVS